MAMARNTSVMTEAVSTRSPSKPRALGGSR